MAERQRRQPPEQFLQFRAIECAVVFEGEQVVEAIARRAEHVASGPGVSLLYATAMRNRRKTPE